MIEKLEAIKAVAAKAGNAIKSRYVVADFALLTKYQDYSLIAEKIKDIDIAMIILSTGEEVEQTVTMNALHPIYLSKALIP